MKPEYRAIAVNPFDNWVYGNLLIIEDEITEKTEYYIQTDNSKIRVLPDTICRKVYEYNGIKFFDKDIVEYEHWESHNVINRIGVRRIEPIIDDSLVVYIGRQRNEYAFKILGYNTLNIKILGNTIENPDLLNQEWSEILIDKKEMRTQEIIESSIYKPKDIY